MDVAPRRTPPNIYDVAQAAGVSHQTVSRVLNDSARTGQATRDRVLAAIAQLGYRRNLAARILATRRTQAIGVLVPAVSDFGPTTTLHAIERGVRDLGYRPLITAIEPERDSLVEGIEFLLAQGIEGLILVTAHTWARDVMASLRVEIPAVSVHAAEPGTLSVAIDQGAGVRLAVAHLLSLGHSRLQHLAGPLDYVEAEQRADAFERFVNAAMVHRGPHVRGDWSAASGYDAAAGIEDSTTAVFCANDQMALGLISGLTETGRRVPEDVSIVGFDDLPEAAYFGPPLTTVRQDFIKMGRLAAELLVAELDAPGREGPRVIRPTLVHRQSTARLAITSDANS